MRKTNRQVLKETFLCWGDTEMRRLKQYADAGKKFLCGKDYQLFARDNCG